jgi:exosortase/archaeosortase family protein
MGILGSGIVIVLLNLRILSFLKLNDKMISFSSNFLFITISIYSFILLLPRYLFMDRLTNLSGYTAVFFLNFIKPTTAKIVINYPDLNNVIINFDGSTVGVGDACSGAMMLTVFIAAVVAFYIASSKKNFKRMLRNVFFGGILFYFINVLRIIILILINRYYGSEIMYFFHINLGWILFVIGMGVFWYYEFDEL